ncbi:MAG: small mechanosensitive ion channel [Xanthobacteraceae bacterium]|jgi:small-conductance mechanosensitive channel|nr:small mechanosensitive ion channel [Xanthobacteraceae bacterium]
MPSSLYWSPIWQLIVVGVAGIVVWHLVPQYRANTRMLAQLAFFGVMTAILVSADLVPFRYEDSGTTDTGALLLIAAAKFLWWLHLAWAIIGVVRIYLVLEGKPREARLLQDLVVGIVYLGMALSVLAFVFGAPIGTLIATSGAVAIIVGLALQNTLSDVFSGIALTLGRPYALGDWILLNNGVQGRVVESTWRSTNILTPESNVVVVPNSSLAKLELTNVSRPDEHHRVSLSVRIAPTRLPSSVIAIMRDALLNSGTILTEPQPVVALKALDAVAIEVELQFWVAAPSQGVLAKNEVFDLAYRHAKSMGLLFAAPLSSVSYLAHIPTDETAPSPATPLELIRAIPAFEPLTADEQREFADAAVSREFRKGEAIAHQGDKVASLMIVQRGVVAISIGDRDGGRLAPGDYLGQTGLWADAEPGTLKALTDVALYEIDEKVCAAILARRPIIAEKLAEILAQRSQAGTPADSPDHKQQRGARVFLNAIQTILRA